MAHRSVFAPAGARARDRAAIVLFVVIAGVACSRLPGHALPRGALLPASAYVLHDAVAYRALVRSDFRAAAPRQDVADHAAEMGAYTCAVVAPVSMQVEVARTAAVYVARAAGIAFRAEMDRECSWWNPDSGMPRDYVLEHEQIHFAIVELAARDLSGRVGHLEATGNSPEAAAHSLDADIDLLMHAALERVIARQTRFDEDTSGRIVPEIQRRWRREVERELEGG